MRELCENSLHEAGSSGGKLTIYTDGSSHSNPGPAGAGAVFIDEKGKIVRQISKFLGEMTNNGAEYSAFILALEEAVRMNAQDLEVNLDSELVVKQIRGEYKVREENLRPLYQAAKELIENFERVEIKAIQREKNKQADKLANHAINEAIRAGQVVTSADLFCKSK